MIAAVEASGGSFLDFWRARDEAVVTGLRGYAPQIVSPLEALSRGTSPQDLDTGWERLRAKGLADADVVLQPGLELREAIEQRTDQLTAQPWEELGEAAALAFADEFEPPCELLLQRVDETAGPNYQPASRSRRHYTST